MKTFMKYLLVFTLVSLTMVSCEHKELCLDHSHMHRVRVEFDWRNAPDANPSNMAAYFFSEGSFPQRYNFEGRDGDIITISEGDYTAIGMNGDHIEWSRMRATDDIETFELYTRDSQYLSASGLRTSTLPRTRGTEDERMAITPGMLWNHRVNDIRIDEDSVEQVITFYPSECVCYYTVTVIDVKGLTRLESMTLDATLTGMVEGFLHGWHSPSDVPVTMTYELTGKDQTTLYGEFLTFGECFQSQQKHYVNIYTVYTDGTGGYFSFDVTDQVSKAPDPRHVDIVIRGMEIPQPLSPGPGLDPYVSEWKEANETIIM